MEFIASMKLHRRSIGMEGPDRAAAIQEERLIALSSWMMVLGTVRVICTFADLASAFVNATRLESISTQMFSNFIEEYQPFLALGVVWPLFLGVVVRRTRWPELLFAAGVSFLVLSIGGLLESIAEWNHVNAVGVTFGSFHLTRPAFLNPTLSEATLGLLGACQLLLEFATAVRCLLLFRHLRGFRARSTEPGKQDGARRARLGRIAVYASVGLLVLTVRLPVWSTYIEIINDSRIVREFVLKNDLGGGRRHHRGVKPSREERRMLSLQRSLGVAFVAMRAESFLEAKEAYLDAVSQAEPAAGKPWPAGYGPIIAQARNNLAWLLATCPKAEMRDPRQALEHARAAVALESQTGNYWNTLGVALYRNGDWDQANDALCRSMKLRGDGDSFDWFFLAVIHHKQGRTEQALDLYRKAVQWQQHYLPHDQEIDRFRVEAAKELGLPKPAPPPEFPGDGRSRMPRAPGEPPNHHRMFLPRVGGPKAGPDRG